MKLPILLMLEQDEDDRYITQTVIEEQNCKIDLRFAYNSHEVFSFLKYSNELPSLIMLNQYSTPLNALDILKRLKANPEYNFIPIVVLSGTKNSGMIKECYANGASSFIQKPVGNHETNYKITTFIKYWFETAELN
jgi:response regulator RpfG family c-di-GMP phosphodiesterase